MRIVIAGKEELTVQDHELLKQWFRGVFPSEEPRNKQEKYVEVLLKLNGLLNSKIRPMPEYLYRGKTFNLDMFNSLLKGGLKSNTLLTSFTAKLATAHEFALLNKLGVILRVSRDKAVKSLIANLSKGIDRSLGLEQPKLSEFVLRGSVVHDCRKFVVVRVADLMTMHDKQADAYLAQSEWLIPRKSNVRAQRLLIDVTSGKSVIYDTVARLERYLKKV